MGNDHHDLVRELVGIADRVTALVAVLVERFGPASPLTDRAVRALRTLELLRAEVVGHGERSGPT